MSNVDNYHIVRYSKYKMNEGKPCKVFTDATIQLASQLLKRSVDSDCIKLDVLWNYETIDFARMVCTGLIYRGVAAGLC